MSLRDTKNYTINTNHYCCYCGELLYGNPKHDTNGSFVGEYFKCDCKKALIEDKLNDEIDELCKKYEHHLTFDKDVIFRNIFLSEVIKLKKELGISDSDISYMKLDLSLFLSLNNLDRMSSLDKNEHNNDFVLKKGIKLTDLLTDIIQSE